jgi:hypothetical protein
MNAIRYAGKRSPLWTGSDPAVDVALIVLNGSPLFTGDAGSGESEIRRWVLENDWLEAIVALPDQLFYNTGLATYIWVLTNKKPKHRRGKVQLIKAVDLFEKMKKSLGNKRNELSAEHIATVATTFGEFRESAISKVFDNEDFGYRLITVERPLRLSFQASPERLAFLRDEKASAALARSKKKGAAGDKEIAEGTELQEAILAALDRLEPKTVYKKRDLFEEERAGALKHAVLSIPAPVKKAILSTLGERDESAKISTDSKGRPEPDSDLRDTEDVPLKEDVAVYFEREVKPHVPDAWIAGVELQNGSVDARTQEASDGVAAADLSAPVTLEHAFIAQCEADYTLAEITAIAHVAPGQSSPPTHMLAVVELLHKHLEPNPLIGLAPERGGYPRRIDLGARGGKLLIQRWHVPVRDGIQWYRACANGSMTVPGKDASKPTVVPLGQLGEDPPWPHVVVEVEQFWEYSEFWGDRPGGSRWHRLLPLTPVDIAIGWQAGDFEKARNFLAAEVHIDLLSRSVLMGSCHLRLPNPIYRDVHQRVGSDRQSVTFDLEPYPNQSLDGLELTIWNQRSWGATSVRRMTLQPGINALSVPEGVEQVANAVTCKKRGLLKQAGPFGFASVGISMNLVSDQRRVETPKGRYTVGVVGHSQPMHIGTPRPAGALTRLAADEGQQREQKAWSATAFRWFDNDSLGGTQAIRDIIQSASKSVDLLDPYFGRCDLLEFALATTKHGLPFRVLTSADFCSGGDDPDLRLERGDALVRTLESVRAQDPRLKIEIKVMPGQKSPVHDRFLIVDGTVWVLGASLNEFGSRGSLLMRLPTSPAHSSGSSAFSVSASVFDAHWTSSDALSDWVLRRAASRTGSRSPRPVTLKERARSTKTVLDEALQRIREVWRA